MTTRAIVQPDEVARELDPDVLIREAREHAGLTDFGDERFMIALRTACESYRKDVRFHADGLHSMREVLVNQLVNRLRIEQDLQRHPEIADEDVSDPMIILGMPRSGTTKSFRMLAADDSLLKTRTWQLINPAPFPGAGSGPDPRIAAAIRDEPLLDETVSTAIKPAHEFAAEEPQDEAWLLRFTFNDDLYMSGNVPSPSFEDWLETRKEPSDLMNYEYLRTLIQYLQWQQGGRSGRRWLFKNCFAMAHLDELVKVFPNATYLHVHRDPRQFMGSVSQMTELAWPAYVADTPPTFIGQYQLRRARRVVARYVEARKRLQLDDRIIDVSYEQVRDDPMPPIRDFYALAGHPLTESAREAMAAWSDDNEQGKHGQYRYTLEQFGLSNEIVDEAFADYIGQFIDSDRLGAIVR